MVAVTLEFPLGVYHAQSAFSQTQAEWPPSPLRLVGALLAAVHGRGDDEDRGADRALVQRLCEQPSPEISAPPLERAVSARHETPQGSVVREVRGPTRWVPRNYFGPHGRTQAEASKVGVAVGDHVLRFVWPDLDLTDADRVRLQSMLEDMSFLGTSRSPVVAYLAESNCVHDEERWIPAPAGAPHTTPVRVPNSSTIAMFDARHELRRATKDRPEKAGLVPAFSIGGEAAYAFGPDLLSLSRLIDPGQWDDAIVIAIDREQSDALPKTAASYLLARAFRVALLSAFGDVGESQEAPPILTGRDAEPHCSIVPLADIWNKHASGNILGVALVFPSEARVPDLAAQRVRVEWGLGRLVTGMGSGSRYVRVPSVGHVHLRIPEPSDAYRRTLDFTTYSRPSRRWASATSIVHSRWRKGGQDGLHEQVATDCRHVGLPEPISVKRLRSSKFPGAASAPITGDRVPRSWRPLLGGPRSHVEITFADPVSGPIVLGKARHFGLGLMIPIDERAPRDERQ